ncbi:MAG TPA: methyltransferase domain-containing protein [Candidatus Obscuribacterales bacterium]
MNTQTEFDSRTYKEQLRRNWANDVSAWQRFHPQYVSQTRAATELIVQAAQAGTGMQVLDLACGTGEPALTLAEAVGTEGHVTATDLVPEMLAAAEEYAHQRGLTNLSFRVADIESLPFADQSFDAVTCRFGIMFCPNVGKALAEIRRVLKPGGRAAFVAWGPMPVNPMFSCTIGVVSKHVSLPPPPAGTPSPFVFARPGSLSEGMSAAGFLEVQESSETLPWTFPGPSETCWEFMRAVGPFERIFAALPPEQHEPVIEEVLNSLRQYEEEGQVKLTAVVVLATGTR